MDISFLGYGEQAATFKAASTVEAGSLVKMSENFEVEPADGSGDVFCGKALSVRGSYVTVQLSGYMTAQYSGTISLGYNNVEIDASGKVKVAASGGNKILVINKDTTNTKIGFIL